MLDSLINSTENLHARIRTHVLNTIFPELISCFFSFFQKATNRRNLIVLLKSHHTRHYQRFHLHHTHHIPHHIPVRAVAVHVIPVHVTIRANIQVFFRLLVGVAKPIVKLRLVKQKINYILKQIRMIIYDFNFVYMFL